MINRRMRKDTGNHGRNAKKRKKRRNPKGEDGISIRWGNAKQAGGGAGFNARFNQEARELEKKNAFITI